MRNTKSSLLREVIYRIDFLSQPVKLNFEGRKTYPTKVGAALSLACFGIFCSLLYSIIDSYLDTTKPRISTETEFMKVKERVDLKQNKLYPVFFFYGNITKILPIEEVLRFTHPVIARIVYRMMPNGTESEERTYLDLVPCKQLVDKTRADAVQPETEGYVKSNYYNFGFCVDDHGQSLELGGDKDPTAVDIFLVALYPCILTDGTCKPSASLGEFGFIVSFQEPVTNLGEKEKPIVYSSEANVLQGISVQFSTKVFSNLRVNHIIEERGFLSKPTVTHRFASVDSQSPMFTTRDPGQSTCKDFDINTCSLYFEHIFTLSNKKLKIVREYKGIVESISEVGGIIDIIFLLFTSVYAIYHQRVVENFAIEQLYEVQGSKPVSCFGLINKMPFGPSKPLRESNVSYQSALGRLADDMDLLTILQDLKKIKAVLCSVSSSLSKDSKKGASQIHLLELKDRVAEGPGTPASPMQTNRSPYTGKAFNQFTQPSQRSDTSSRLPGKGNPQGSTRDLPFISHNSLKKKKIFLGHSKVFSQQIQKYQPTLGQSTHQK